jgi:hypothetical protein
MLNSCRVKVYCASSKKKYLCNVCSMYDKDDLYLVVDAYTGALKYLDESRDKFRQQTDRERFFYLFFWDNRLTTKVFFYLLSNGFSCGLMLIHQSIFAS